MAHESLKDLPPQERIRKLKELEQQKKKEIEDAQKLIKDSEAEINDQVKLKEKVPLEALSKSDDDTKGLSSEEKEVIKRVKGINTKSLSDDEPEVKAKQRKIRAEIEEREEAESLEAMARHAKVDPQVMQSEYTLHLSQKPMHNLYEEISNINREVHDKGYINEEEQRRIRYLSSAVERKIEDAQSGKYTFTEEVAMAANLSQQIGARLLDNYHPNKKRGHAEELYRYN